MVLCDFGFLLADISLTRLGKIISILTWGHHAHSYKVGRTSCCISTVIHYEKWRIHESCKYERLVIEYDNKLNDNQMVIYRGYGIK